MRVKSFFYLIFSKLLYLLCLFSLTVCAQEKTLEPFLAESSWQDSLKQAWDDDVQFHGFLSQGLFHTTGNNVYGHSKNSVSAGLTEFGLNVSYQALDNLSFAAQGLYRRAGAGTGDWGDVSLDFAFIDYTFFRHSQGRIGIRGGRVKKPWGLYNETRDVAFTHPTIFLPLTYFERSRSLLISMDGAQLYAEYNTSVGDFTFKFNYGYIYDNGELLLAIVNNRHVMGDLKSEPSFMTQLRYEILGGEYVFAISYANLNLDYKGQGAFDPYSGLQVHIYPIVLSGQYSGEKFSFASEYSVQWNEFTGITHIRPDFFPISEHWYVQGGYRILDNLEFTIRYDKTVHDIHDRSGVQFNQRTGLPAYLMFTQDLVFGLRWDITPAWMIRTEYHRVHGASRLSAFDNPEFSDTVANWNIYALQVAFRF